MIQYIKGILTEKNSDTVTVETQGMGYEIWVPPGGKIHSAAEGEPVVIYVEMIIKDEEVKLYGFHSAKDKELFKRLISVSGVGAKMAMGIFSAMAPDEITRAIIFDDPAMLCRAKGLGKKTAQKIILELKDKVGQADEISAASGKSGGDVAGAGEKGQAVAALVELGYSRMEAVQMLDFETEGELSTEEYIKRALRNI